MTEETLFALALEKPGRAERDAVAVALAVKVRDARVRKHGDVHPHTIDAVAHLANVYNSGYKITPARELLERTEKLTLLKLGPYHPLTLVIQRNLAGIYRAYQKTSRAIALPEEVRDKQVMILGGHHPATLTTLEELGIAYRSAGETGKALSVLQQAAAGVEKLEFAHNHAYRIIENLARCHEQLQQYERAESWRRRWVAVAKEPYGPEGFWYANFWGLAGLGANLVRQKKYAEAEPILRESLAVLRKNFPAWDSSRAESLLGAALMGQQKYAEAEPHLVEAYRGITTLAKVPGHAHHGPIDRQNLTEALERLVQLYEATNRPDEAARWRKELATIRAVAKPPAHP